MYQYEKMYLLLVISCDWQLHKLRCTFPLYRDFPVWVDLFSVLFQFDKISFTFLVLNKDCVLKSIFTSTFTLFLIFTHIFNSNNIKPETSTKYQQNTDHNYTQFKSVVYFDQCLCAEHSKPWLKSAFSTFVMLKAENKNF